MTSRVIQSTSPPAHLPPTLPASLQAASPRRTPLGMGSAPPSPGGRRVAARSEKKIFLISDLRLPRGDARQR